MEFAAVLVVLLGLFSVGAAVVLAVTAPGLTGFGATVMRGRRAQKALTFMTEQVALAQTELYLRNRQLEDLSRRLELSNRELARLNHMKSRFLSMVTHDLRTPLMTAQGFATVLQQRATPQQGEMLGHISRATARMGELMGDLTDLAMIEAGKLRMEPAPFDLAASARELASGMQVIARGKAVALVLEELPASFIVTGDRVRLVQALQNLLGNAIKFTPPGGRVSLRVRAEGSRARVSVRDTGPGLRAAEKQAVFEKFYQSPDHRAAAREGWGLGLSIAAEIVRAHGGTIGVDSAGPGKGCQFWFRIPVRRRP